MNRTVAESSTRCRRDTPWWIGFFAVAFAYVWLVVEPTLQYHSFAPVFFTTARFFREFLGYPGGGIDYAGAFILQFFRFSWLGALLTVGLGVVVFASTRGLVNRLGWKGGVTISLVPAVLLFVVQSQYSTPWFSRALGIVAAAAFAAVYVLIGENRRWRGGLYWIAAGPIYFVLGGDFLLFASICALYEFFGSEQWLLALSIVGSALLIPAIAFRYVFVITPRDAFFYLVPLTGAMPTSFTLKALFGVIPAVLVIAALRQLILGVLLQRASTTSGTGTNQEAPRSPSRKPGSRPSDSHSRKTSRNESSWGAWIARVLQGEELLWLSHPAPWLALMIGFMWLSHSASGKALALIDYYAEHEDWARVIDTARKLKVANPVAVNDVNRALAHKNQLLDSMFEFPQQQGLELWLNLNHDMDTGRLLKSSELLLDLGHVNRAERMAAESLELNGYRPETLKQLFLVSVLKEQTQTGVPFLNLLEQTLWHKDWARSQLRAIQTDPSLSSDVNLESIRKNMVRQDYVGSIPDNVMMQISLRQNPQNQLAFQYLMALYLLTGQLEKVGQNLERLELLKLTVLPRHLQEAVVLHEKTHPGTRIDLHGMAIAPALEQRYLRFKEAATRCTADSAPAILAREFGDTFWYFYMTGHSGAVMPSGSSHK
jgi:hypothetical protein